eukprot:6410081-Pyramimonas_sp.AAC.1
MEVREERKGRDGTHHRTAPGASGPHGPRRFRRGDLFRDSTAAKPEMTRKRGSVRGCEEQWI